MPNPDYATLLPLIAAETDPVAKLTLIAQAYQFNEPLTQEEIDLWGYIPLGYVSDLDNDYSVFTEYVGTYYNAEGEDTLSQRIATQKLRVTSIIKGGNPAVEGDVDGIYSCTITADGPLANDYTFTVAIYGRGGDLVGETLLGANTNETISAGQTSRITNVTLSVSDNDVVSDIYTNSDFELAARVSNVVNTQTFSDAPGDDFVIPLAEVATAFTVAPVITIATATTISTVFDVSFNSSAFPSGSRPKSSFSVDATVTTGSNVYNFTDVLQIQADSDNTSVTGTISIPQGTNFYNTPGNVAVIQLTASSGAGGYENLVFTSVSRTTLTNQMPEDLYNVLSSFNNNTTTEDVVTAIESTGLTVIAQVDSGDIAEGLQGRSSPLTTDGFVREYWDNARALGNSTGFLNQNLNGLPFYGFAAIDDTGYRGSGFVMFSNTQNNCTQPTTVPEMFTNLVAPVNTTVPVTNPEDYFVIRAFADNRTDGTTFEDVSDTLGWGFTNAQGAGSNGYYTATELADDDGVWGFIDTGVIQGNGNEPLLPVGVGYSANNGYYFGNFNGLDTTADAAWGTSTIAESNLRFFIFVA